MSRLARALLYRTPSTGHGRHALCALAFFLVVLPVQASDLGGDITAAVPVTLAEPSAAWDLYVASRAVAADRKSACEELFSEEQVSPLLARLARMNSRELIPEGASTPGREPPSVRAPGESNDDHGMAVASGSPTTEVPPACQHSGLIISAPDISAWLAAASRVLPPNPFLDSLFRPPCA